MHKKSYNILIKKHKTYQELIIFIKNQKVVIKMINVGIIGVGRIGRVHGESISKFVPNARVKAVADPF